MNVEHRDNLDEQTMAGWDALCHETTVALQRYFLPFLTPISRVIRNDGGKGEQSAFDAERVEDAMGGEDTGQLEGTGSYVQLDGRRLLITNEHVLRNWQVTRFAHQMLGCEDVFGLAAPLALEPYPVDAAVCPISDRVWRSRPHQGGVVPSSRFALTHDPVPGELLFVTGYAQQRSVFLFGSLVSRATPLLTQEPPAAPNDLHPNHFLLAYSTERAQSVDPKQAVPLPSPPGLSGSLVWNTRRVEYLAEKRQWSPAVAQVTGLVCRWDSAVTALQAVRIEVIRDFLASRLGAP